MMCQNITSLLPWFSFLFRSQSCTSLATYSSCLSATSFLVTGFLQVMSIAGPTSMNSSVFHSGTTVIHLPRKKTPGSLTLLRSILRLYRQSNVECDLCQLATRTGTSWQSYRIAYFTNPFRLFMNSRSSLGVVSVAYSKPPGTRAMSLPYFIRRCRLAGLTVSAPIARRKKPSTGTNSIILEHSTTAFQRRCWTRLNQLGLVNTRMPKASTECGWKAYMTGRLRSAFSCSTIACLLKQSRWSQNRKTRRYTQPLLRLEMRLYCRAIRVVIISRSSHRPWQRQYPMARVYAMETLKMKMALARHRNSLALLFLTITIPLLVIQNDSLPAIEYRMID